MSVPTTASAPTALVSEIPGRFAPIYAVDKRAMSAVTTSTTTTALLAELPRAESANSTFSTPTTEVTELGTNFHVGEFDDLPEAKLSISCFDVGPTVIALVTGKAAPVAATTVYGFNDLATASVDVVRQFADPNGNVFASMYMGDMVIEDYSLSLKSKSAAMEAYSLCGFNMILFRGYIVTKAYVVLTADVTSHSIPIGTTYGVNEGPVAIPVPGGSSPASYWIQRGSLNFLKVEKWRSGHGFVRVPEVTVAPTAGFCEYVPGASPPLATLLFTAGDLVVGDVILATYCTYATNVVNYTTIPQLTVDTSDPVAIPTRLTPFTVSAKGVSRGTAVDLKMTLKRDRAEGIGDVDGLWGPPDAPEVSLTIDVKKTDFGLLSIMQNGDPRGTDTGGTVAGDFFDPNYMTRIGLSTSVPLVITLNDPRNAGVVLKTITSPTAVFKAYDNTSQAKSPITEKFTGSDKVGNVTISVTR